MPRQARLVIPDIPHHVIQRGNRRQDVFFSDDDRRMYLALLKEICEEFSIPVLAYCLMSNHIHLIVVPRLIQNFRPVGEVNRRYARYINAKKEWRGFLWQGRFSSYPMDETHLYEAIRYIELNPVRAGLCKHPSDYSWSSARQRINANHAAQDFKVDSLVSINDWESYWNDGLTRYETIRIFDENETSMKPLGNIPIIQTGT